MLGPTDTTIRLGLTVTVRKTHALTRRRQRSHNGPVKRAIVSVWCSRFLVVAQGLACQATPEPKPPPEPEPEPVAEPPDECAEATFCHDPNAELQPKEGCGKQCAEVGGASCRAAPAALAGQACETPSGGGGIWIKCMCSRE